MVDDDHGIECVCDDCQEVDHTAEWAEFQRRWREFDPSCPHDDVTVIDSHGWYCTSCRVRFQPFVSTDVLRPDEADYLFDRGRCACGHLMRIHEDLFDCPLCPRSACDVDLQEPGVAAPEADAPGRQA